MIIFDYGHTLAYEPGFDGIMGINALLPYAIGNKHHLDASTVNHVSNDFFSEIIQTARKAGFELHQHMFDKLLFDYLDIHFNLSPLQMEEIFWNSASPDEAMPFATQLLDYLNEHHIRTAVISNLSFSSAALTNRLNHLFPNNRFEFIIASSEYILRKPNLILFKIALNKAKLNPDEIWFCGNNPATDLEGAAGLDIFPVWYDNELPDPFNPQPGSYHPDFEYLHITSWQALINHLEALYHTLQSQA